MNTELYTQIETAIRSYQEQISIYNPTTADEIRHAVRWVMRDNPDIFWFAHQYHYDKIHSSIHFHYTFSAERVDTIKQSITDVIENDFCIDYVRTLTPQEQITYVYKWLVSYCNYNVNSAYNQTICSVFVRRNSVCTGYAKAAQYLFKLLDIDSRLVFGRLHNDKEDGRHCWNLVKYGNQYYHFDACFGDRILDGVALHSGVEELFIIDGVNYNFLCISTHEMLKTRIIEDVVTLPSCLTSWSKEVVRSLAGIEIKQREDIKGCLLSHIGSSADIYLCSKDKNTVLKVFRSNSKTTCTDEYSYMRRLKGCNHILQPVEQYTDLSNHTIAIEQSIPLVDLLCSHYYELTLKGLFKIIIDIATAWQECRNRGILYRDIHICNIYRTNEGTFKLGDFGSCTDDFKAKEIVGNQWFMAPETFVHGIFTESSAVYSISMVMYFILNNMRPAFWALGSEDEALQKRMHGDSLPIPVGCAHLPHNIQTKITDFFNNVVSVYRERRISHIDEFLYSVIEIFDNFGYNDYTILPKGISLDFDIEAGNRHRLGNPWVYLNRAEYHKYAMGNEVERMCTTARSQVQNMRRCENGHIYDADIYDDKCPFCIHDDINLASRCESLSTAILSVDELENFARTKGECNDEGIYVDSNKFSGSEWLSNFIVDEVESLAYSTALPIPPQDANIVGDDGSYNIDWMDAFVIDPVPAAIKGSDNFSCSYESFAPFRSLPDNTRLQNLKNEYEKAIIHLNNEQKQLNLFHTQIVELKKQKNEIENQSKNSSGKSVGSTSGGLLATIIGGFVGIAGALLAPPPATSFDETIEKQLDEALEAKMEQAQMCERRIEGFIQQKCNLEKELAILEEQSRYNEVFSSIFSPAEVKRKSHLQVQVYLHLYEETEIVKSLAKEADKNAERRDYIPLSLKLKKGDRVDVEFNVYGETKLMSERKSLIWQGSFTKCSFDYFVPENINVDELSCQANLCVNGALIGEMRFLTQIVDTPRDINPEIFSHCYKKIFISYAHKDFSKVKFMAQAYKAQGVDYFLDRDYLKAGDIYPKKIQDYINSADLFVLCWSRNAAESDYVAKEKAQALSIAKNTNHQDGTLTIHPISIVPRAELPDDMKDNYNFDTI